MKKSAYAGLYVHSKNIVVVVIYKQFNEISRNSFYILYEGVSWC